MFVSELPASEMRMSDKLMQVGPSERAFGNMTGACGKHIHRKRERDLEREI